MDSIEILKFYLKLGEDIISERYLNGISYSFLDNSKFAKIRDGYKLNQVYWNEMLTRAHWASVSTILRNTSWLKGIIHSYDGNNFLPFAGNLRAFVESCGDSMTSLQAIPLTIARDYNQISDSVKGRKLNPIVNPELEEMLIHFQYARKLSKSEKELDSVPKSHEAKFITKYIEVMDGNKPDGPVKRLYSELCQFVHPAAHSVMYNMIGFEEDDYTIMKYNENATPTVMHNFINDFQDSINTVCQYGYNNALVILKLLNLVGIKELETPKLNSIQLTNINVWNKAVALIYKNH